MSTNRLAQEERNAEMRKRMLNVSNFEIGPLPNDSPWVKPVRLSYLHDGKRIDWDAMRTKDSVCIIIYNTSRDKMVFVKQFRPASYFLDLPAQLGPIDVSKYPLSKGLSLELCAGVVDKDKPLIEIAKEEVEEECGYEVKVENMQQVLSYRTIADAVAMQTLFYAEVTDDMLVHSGGGLANEGEIIEVVEMDVEDVKKYISQPEVLSPPSFLFGVHWFLLNKYKKDVK